jgi:hypothetical protein
MQGYPIRDVSFPLTEEERLCPPRHHPYLKLVVEAVLRHRTKEE